MTTKTTKILRKSKSFLDIVKELQITNLRRNSEIKCKFHHFKNPLRNLSKQLDR